MWAKQLILVRKWCDGVLTLGSLRAAGSLKGTIVALPRFCSEIAGVEARTRQRGVKRPFDVKARTEEAIFVVRGM
jgi:hypothetical protein